jgi:hypothetical protein
MTAVMIGIDAHKVSHTAVDVSGAEEPLGASCGCAPVRCRPSGWQKSAAGRARFASSTCRRV